MRRRLVNAYLSSIISITLVLVLVGLAAVVLVSTGRMTDYLKENVSMTVELDVSVNDDDAEIFFDEVSSERYVKDASYITKEQAIQDLKKDFGAEFFDDFMGDDMLPSYIEIAIDANYVSSDSLSVIKGELLESGIVEEVVYPEKLVDSLNSNLNRISLILFCLIALMLFISYVLINNTVRLNVYAKRFTVHTMNLVGATRSFVRRPFVIKAVFQGLFSALLAVACIIGLLFLVKDDLGVIFDLVFSLNHLLIVIGVIVFSGLAICVTSTFFVVNKLISLKKEELYY